MSKRDFAAIANTLDANHADLALVQDMADTLAETNPRFNRELFIAASTNNLREDHMRSLRALDLSTGRV